MEVLTGMKMVDTKKNIWIISKCFFRLDMNHLILFEYFCWMVMIPFVRRVSTDPTLYNPDFQAL